MEASDRPPTEPPLVSSQYWIKSHFKPDQIYLCSFSLYSWDLCVFLAATPTGNYGGPERSTHRKTSANRQKPKRLHQQQNTSVCVWITLVTGDILDDDFFFDDSCLSSRCFLSREAAVNYFLLDVGKQNQDELANSQINHFPWEQILKNRSHSLDLMMSLHTWCLLLLQCPINQSFNQSINRYKCLTLD